MVAMLPGKYPVSGLLYDSKANASSYTPREVHTEDDVLHQETLPDFEGTLGQRDSELLISYLTVPYIRIPLILNFFASEDRVYSLKAKSLCELLERTLFEPSKYLAKALVDGLDKDIVPKDVPCSNPELIATTHGLLLNELQHSPRSVLPPLKLLLAWAIDSAASSVSDQIFETALFLTRMVARVVSLGRYLLHGWRGGVPGFDVWLKALHPTDENKEYLKRSINELDCSLNGRNLDAAGSSGVGRVASMRQRLVERLGEVSVRSGLHCGLSDADLINKVGEGERDMGEDSGQFLFLVKTRSDLHAHMLLIYRGMPTEEFDEEACKQALSSILFLTTRHTWDRSGLWAPESEVTEALDEVRRKASNFLARSAEKDVSALIRVCQHVYKIVITKENRSATWCRVLNSRNRYVVCPTAEGYAEGAPVSNSAPWVGEGNYDVELDLSVVELRVAGGYLMSLDDDVSQNKDVQEVLGKNIVTLQCIALRDSPKCREREIVGLKTRLTVYAWARDDRMEPRGQYEREYVPQELPLEEAWIPKLFEPVRSSLFTPPNCEAELSFSLTEEPHKASARVATLVASHPTKSGAWLEVVLLREFGAVNVFMMESYGMQYRRDLIYTNNVLLSYSYLQPSSDKRDQAWERWGRQEAARKLWDSCRKKPFQPPPYGRSCTISRPVPPGVKTVAERPAPAEAVDQGECGQPNQEDDEKNQHEVKVGSVGDNGKEGKAKEARTSSLGSESSAYISSDGSFYEVSTSGGAEPLLGVVSDDGDVESEQFIPSRYLSMVPHALCNDYAFWQSGWDKSIIRGYKLARATKSSKGDVGDQRRGLAEAEEHSVTIFLKEEVSAATSQKGIVGRVVLHGENKGDKDEVLLDLLHADPKSALMSIARTLCRAENASNMLVWGRELPDQGEVRIMRLQMHRMRQNFVVREHKDVSEDVSRFLLFNKDQPSVYIADRPASWSKDLVAGVDHHVLLSSLERQSTIMVPNVKFKRPQVKPLPFSTEIVLQYEDEEGKDWRKKSQMNVFLYSVHASGSSLVPNCLSAAIYLLSLKMINREYAAASEMVASVSTDAEFTEQEENVLTCLEETLTDSHPDAHAIRCRITLAVLDSPVNLPWDIRAETANYFTKVRHVRAVCRLSEREEEVLVEGAILFNKMLNVVDKASARYDKGSLHKWYQLLLNPKERKQAPAQSISDAEGCITTMTQMIQANTGVACHRNRVLQLLEFALQQRKVNAALWKIVTNQEALIKASENAAQCKRKSYRVSCSFPTRQKTSGREYYCDKKVLTLQSQDLMKESVHKEKMHETFSEVRLSQDATVSRPIDARSDEEWKVSDWGDFFWFFAIMTGKVPFKSLGCTPHAWTSLMVRFCTDDAARGSIGGSILSILGHNPDVARNVPCHKSLASDDAYEGGNNPSLEYLKLVVQHIQKHKDQLKIPTRAAALPTRARIRVPKPSKTLLDECPSLNVKDYDAQDGVLDCGKSAQIAWGAMLGSGAGDEEGYYTPEVVEALARQPMMQCAAEFLIEKNKQEVPKMPFEADELGSNASTIERKMIQRMDNDYKNLAELTAKSKLMELKCLSKGKIQEMEQGGAENGLISEAIDQVKAISCAVEKMKEEDDQAFSAIKATLEGLANGDDALQKHTQAERYRMLIISGHRPRMGFSFLVTTLLSSQGGQEWTRINPHLNKTEAERGPGLLVLALLHSTRICQCNRVLTELFALSKVLGDMSSGSLGVKQGCIVIAQKSSMLGELLGVERTHFVRLGDSFYFRPHFLVFEFQKGIILRERQVTLVRQILESLQASPPKPIVKQMIMGQGKTCVISPLLGLSLADTRRLVMQVVPAALLDFSRSELRQALSNTLGRRIYTLNFERSSVIDSRIYKKLKSACDSGAVVVATPASVKSLVLKFVENMMTVADPNSYGRREAKRQVQEAQGLFALLREAIVIMDEVDLILHPLKSELNFPIGPRQPLQLGSRRWQLPIFLLDAFHSACDDANLVQDASVGPRAREMVEALREAMHQGAEDNLMQKQPHWVLIDVVFYKTHLLRVFARLCLLWMEQEDLDLAGRPWTLTYVCDDKVQEGDWPQFKDAELEMDTRRVLNLARLWVHTILPHVLLKVNRVSYGIMTSKQCEEALEASPLTPRGRLALAVPFVGKDVPSAASEFAHPDVAIGLTVLAYRYEGLRIGDFREAVGAMQQQLSKELGPRDRRPTVIKFADWVKLAGGEMASGMTGGTKVGESDGGVGQPGDLIMPLHLLRRTNEAQIGRAFRLLRKRKEVVSFWVSMFVFPRHTQHQEVKLSACAQELGSEMIFTRRVGFSGTPSSLIPHDLGECGFEPGSEANILNTLTKESIVDMPPLIKSPWEPKDILIAVATDPACYRALIDTGALVTGFSNEEAAACLLEHFPTNPNVRAIQVEGVVYLDDMVSRPKAPSFKPQTRQAQSPCLQTPNTGNSLGTNT